MLDCSSKYNFHYINNGKNMSLLNQVSKVFLYKSENYFGVICLLIYFAWRSVVIQVLIYINIHNVQNFCECMFLVIYLSFRLLNKNYLFIYELRTHLNHVASHLDFMSFFISSYLLLLLLVVCVFLYKSLRNAFFIAYK